MVETVRVHLDHTMRVEQRRAAADFWIKPGRLGPLVRLNWQL